MCKTRSNVTSVLLFKEEIQRFSLKCHKDYLQHRYLGYHNLGAKQWKLRSKTNAKQYLLSQKRLDNTSSLQLQAERWLRNRMGLS